MAAYQARAVSLAAAIGNLAGVRVTQAKTNAFAVYLPGDHQALSAAHLRLAERTGLWLFGLIAATPVPGLAMAEVQVGAVTAAVTDEEAVHPVIELLHGAR